MVNDFFQKFVVSFRYPKKSIRRRGRFAFAATVTSAVSVSISVEEISQFVHEYIWQS